MRRGPNYGQYVNRDDKGDVALRLPLELEHEWAAFRYVDWYDNGDGSYTLTPRRDL